MKRIVPFIFVCLFFFFPMSASSEVHAQEQAVRRGSFTTEVSASVGEFYLNISGYISPYASIVLTSDGVFYRAVVADGSGRFSISDVLIRTGFSGFCLEAVDFKRLGESVTCFSFPPATGNITMRDIFLPPTIGLQRAEIAAGSDALVFGYTMPGATVTIHLQNGVTFTVTADSTGYYEYTIKSLAAGSYQLFANAEYNSKKSENPSKTLALRALSWWEQFVAFIVRIWQWITGVIIGLPLGPLWLAIPLIMLIIILIVRLWPERFTWIYNSRLVYFLQRKIKRKLHHAWFVGY